MLANYNKILPKIAVHAATCEGVVQNLHFQVFMYVLNLFF